MSEGLEELLKDEGGFELQQISAPISFKVYPESKEVSEELKRKILEAQEFMAETMKRQLFCVWPPEYTKPPSFYDRVKMIVREKWYQIRLAFCRLIMWNKSFGEYNYEYDD